MTKKTELLQFCYKTYHKNDLEYSIQQFIRNLIGILPTDSLSVMEKKVEKYDITRIK